MSIMMHRLALKWDMETNTMKFLKSIMTEQDLIEAYMKGSMRTPPVWIEIDREEYDRLVDEELYRIYDKEWVEQCRRPTYE